MNSMTLKRVAGIFAGTLALAIAAEAGEPPAGVPKD